MPKIVLLMDSPIIPTGYASTCRLTGKELKKLGWDVYALAFNGGPQVGPNKEEIFDFNGIKVIRNCALSRNPESIYGDVKTILKINSTINPDIFFWHNDSYRYRYMKELPKEILEKSVFWLPFEGDVPDAPGLEVFGNCSVIRFVTKHALDLHTSILKGKNIGHIYHAIDMDSMIPTNDKLSAKIAKQLGLENKFVVTRVDRHQPRKYWDLTLKAFAKFAENKDDVFLLCKCNPRDVTMWDNNKKEGVDLEVLAKELGIFNKVKFDDFFFDSSYMPRAFYWPADVFITTTSGEGFGLTPVEAMACGCPIIYNDTPVLPEVIGEGGWMFKKAGKEWFNKMSVWHNISDVPDATLKLEEAYQDWKSGGEKLKELGQKARKKAEENYSPKVVYEQWDKTMRDLLEKRDLVSIITVLYNVSGNEQIYGEDGIDKLKNTIELYVNHPYEWIIVDNNSPAKKETKEWLINASSKNKRIKPLFLDINMGYAGGNNAGIKMSIGKKVLLLNPDSEAIPPQKHGYDKDFIALMSDKLTADKNLGILGMEIWKRDDIMPGVSFPYFCCVMISKECLSEIKLEDDKWFDENFWPAYYEDADLCVRAQAKGFKVTSDSTLPVWHKSGGTNKFLVSKTPDDQSVKTLMSTLERIQTEGRIKIDFTRKFGELTSRGMQGLIDGNIKYLNSKWGISARQAIKVVWHTHIGASVGFSQIAEGLIPELQRLGFDLYVNDWSNSANVENKEILQLIEKTKKAKEAGESLHDALHIICWLMETFADVDGRYKIGIAFCESTKVRESYLHLCNSTDRILTFSDFCRNVQKNSGFRVPINTIVPGVQPSFINYHDRQGPDKGKFSFLCVGVSQERKDTRRLVEAFCEAFPKGQKKPPECEDGFPLSCDQVELIVKSNNFGELNWVHSEGYDQKANIKTIFTGWDKRAERKDYSSEEMYNLYCQVDALVHPSHGEGIGLPILEGAATGLPVIFTNWSSPSEYLNSTNSYPISLSPYPGTTFTKAYPGAPGDNGEWANMHVGHLKFEMYNVIRKWSEAKEKGKKSHNLIKNTYNWKESSRTLWPQLIEWDRCRKLKNQLSAEFDPVSFKKPKLEAIVPSDRIMIDVATRDRNSYLSVLLLSLLNQTFKNWDIIIQVDDSDENILNNHLVMSLINRIQHEGHGWRMIRSHRQGPHMAHQRTLQMIIDDKKKSNYKLICRIDDDIYVQPDYLEKLFYPFTKDTKCEIGAIGGVYLDPKRPDKDQLAPSNFKTNIDYAGKLDHNVPWPYVCRYPNDTKLRQVEHLYSSFLYRTEVAEAIGGYCKLFSQIGHREESDFSCRFWFAGYKLFIQPDAIGYHFCAPASGIRSMDIKEKNELSCTDHKIYEKRLNVWRLRHKEKLDLISKEEKNTVNIKINDLETSSGKIACVINGGSDKNSILCAIKRFSQYFDSIYVSCELSDKKSLQSMVNQLADIRNKVRKIGNTQEEIASIATKVLSKGTHEYVVTVSDKMKFVSDPRSILSKNYDEYVFEIYSTYARGYVNQEEFIPNENAPESIGTECRNMCLIARRGVSNSSSDRILYSNIMVIEDNLLPRGNSGKTTQNGNPIIELSEIDCSDWTKICTFQHPEGKLEFPRKAMIYNGKPLVSIIIPTPGRKEHLKKCIDSIYSFTTTKFELIIIDNGSSDGTNEMLESESKIRPNIIVLKQERNLGYQKAVNIGVGKSKGKYILLFNDDAWVDSNEPDGRDWVTTLVDELESDKKIGIVGPHEGNSPALNKNILYFWCVMIRRSTWDEIGTLDDVTFFNYGGDDDYCERLRERGYTIKQKYLHLRHLMVLVPDEIKRPELEESIIKLRSKYNLQM